MRAGSIPTSPTSPGRRSPPSCRSRPPRSPISSSGIRPGISASPPRTPGTASGSSRRRAPPCRWYCRGFSSAHSRRPSSTSRSISPWIRWGRGSPSAPSVPRCPPALRVPSIFRATASPSPWNPSATRRGPAERINGLSRARCCSSASAKSRVQGARSSSRSTALVASRERCRSTRRRPCLWCRDPRRSRLPFSTSTAHSTPISRGRTSSSS